MKKAGRNWRPDSWKCDFCRSDIPQLENQKDDVTEDQPKSPAKVAARHRKSNVISCNHPEKEFLERQINTMKSIIAKREAELKKSSRI